MIRRDIPPDLWQKMAELGWMGLVLPETYGGSGLSFVDLTILMEEMGRVLLPAPFFSSIALGALTLLETGSDEQRQQMLPRLARGEAKVSVALLEADGRYDPRGISMRASIRGNRATLNGTKLFVVDAQVSDYVICVARTRRRPRSRVRYQPIYARHDVPRHRLYPVDEYGPDPATLRGVVHTRQRLS